MKIPSLFNKTLIIVISLFGLITITISLFTSWNLRKDLTDEYKKDGAAIAKTIADSGVDIFLNRDASSIQSLIDQFIEVRGVSYVMVTDAEGEIMAHTFVPTIPEEIIDLHMQLHIRPVRKERMEIMEMHIKGKGNVIDISYPILSGVAGHVHVGMDLEIIKAHIRSAILSQLYPISAIFIISIIAAYFFINRILQPLNKLTDYSKKLASHDFSARVDIKSQDEIGLLSETMQHMADEMSGFVQRLEKAVADATHELKGTLAHLASEKEQLAITLRSIGDGIITTDIAGKITLLNKAAEELTGQTSQDAAGKPLTDVFLAFKKDTGESCKPIIEKILLTGERIEPVGDLQLRSRDGTERAISSRCAPIRNEDNKTIGMVWAFRDITEKQKIEEYQLKIKELETLGVFAGGLAHDFNNLLNIILGNVSFAKMFMSPADKFFKHLEEAEKASTRASELTQRLLILAKGGEPVKKTVSVARLLEYSRRLALSSPDIKCDIHLPENIHLVAIDEEQIGQAMQSLITNAVEAMPNGGLIKISAENVSVGLEDHLPLKQGAYVRISVEDHGRGIPKDILPKIFDPYFTTKEMGTQKGMGLGLTVSYSIIKKHGGLLTAESEVGVGTIFHIYLPAVKG